MTSQRADGYDDWLHHVFGGNGLLILIDLYDVDGAEAQIWPGGAKGFSDLRRLDEYVTCIIRGQKKRNAMIGFR